jgi:hypothetical protein
MQVDQGLKVRSNALLLCYCSHCLRPTHTESRLLYCCCNRSWAHNKLTKLLHLPLLTLRNLVEEIVHAQHSWQQQPAKNRSLNIIRKLGSLLSNFGHSNSQFLGPVCNSNSMEINKSFGLGGEKWPELRRWYTTLSTHIHTDRGVGGGEINTQAGQKGALPYSMSAYSTVYMSAGRECECENGRGGDDGQAQRRGKNEDGRTDSRPTARADSGRLAATRRIKGPSDCCVAKRRKNMGIEEETE